MRLLTTLALSIFLSTTQVSAQKTELIPFGDFEQWLNRDIKESFILGGNTQRVYAVAPNGTIKGEIPYKKGVSPWSTSNALAIVSGITKTSNTVFPEVRSHGNRSVRMESMMVNCKVLGLVNITVMVSGSIFLGETIEPIKDTKNPYTKLDMGIPFTKSPQALVYDYSTLIHDSGKVTTAKGWSVTNAPGKDYCQTLVFLQHRTEHPDGTITARRIATGAEYITKTSHAWVNQHRMPIHYGDITKEHFFKKYMNLNSMYYAKNSKGVMTKVIETGWAEPDTTPTHVIVFFSSGIYGAFVGTVGNVFKVDNIKFEYQ